MSQTNGAGALLSPVSYPTFPVKGKTYILKLAQGAAFRMEKYGIDPGRLKEEINEWNATGKKLQLVFTLAASLMGTEDTEGTFASIGFTPEQLADRIPSDQVAALGAAIMEALIKVQPSSETAQAAAAIPGDSVQ